MDQDAHPSTRRLLDFARRSTVDTPHPVRDWRDLLIRLQVSPATMTNWKKRGISKDGALDAEKEFGCMAIWLLEGSGPTVPSTQAAALSVHIAGEPVPAVYLTDTELLVHMSRLLAKLPAGMHEPFADILAGWARTRGTDRQREHALLRLLGDDGKQRRAARA